MLTRSRAVNIGYAVVVAFFLTLAGWGCKKHKAESGGGSNPNPAPAPAPAPTVEPSTGPVNAPKPSTGTTPSVPNDGSLFGIYDDQGGVLGDANALLFTGGGLTVQERTGDAPEGTKFMRAMNAVSGGFWGVSLDRNNSGNSHDLSSFSNGGLHFFIRVNREIKAGEKLNINLTDAANHTQTVTLSNTVGFAFKKPDAWQEISIQLSDYTNIDKKRIRVPFAIAIEGVGNSDELTIDIDAVRWEKNFHSISVPNDQPPAPAPQPSPTKPSTNPDELGLYNDQGGVLGDPNALLFLGGGITAAEQSGNAPEGNRFMNFNGATDASFWGITFAKTNPQATRDLSAFKSGRLNFFLKLGRALTGSERLLVDVKDASAGSAVTLSTAHGFSSTALDWQQISIPLISFSANKATIQVPIAMSFQGLASPLNFSVDNVRWDK